MPAQNFSPDSDLYAKANPQLSLPIQSQQHLVKIAVIDSGLDYLHPKMARHLRLNSSGEGIGLDLLGHDSLPYPVILEPETGDEVEDFMGDNSHGTHVASLALLGAKMQLPGQSSAIDIGPKLGVIPVRVLPLTDEGIPVDQGDLERDLAMGKKIVKDLTKAIDFSRTEGAHIANLSLGIEASSLHEDAQKVFEQDIQEQLIPAIRDRGQDVLFLFAAGNENVPVLAGNYPASLSFANTLTVGALKDHASIAEYSNYGELVDVYVRGSDVNGLVPGGQREKMSGTSMATPLVANLAAKMKLLAPCLKAWQLKKLLITNAQEKVLKLEGTESDTRTVKVVSFKQGLAAAKKIGAQECASFPSAF